MPVHRAAFDGCFQTALDRRRFLQGGAALAGLIALSRLPGDAAHAAVPRFDTYPCKLGVASGDPLPHGVVLWTRLVPEPFARDGGMPRTDVSVTWQVAADERMRAVLQEGTALAPRALAHSVHVEVEGLEPGCEYFYRFRAGDAESPIGRTRTAPAADAPLTALTFAFASCQHWQSGYYSAYRRMAEEDLDLVVHLGDYIYEGGVDPKGGARDVFEPRVVRRPGHDIFVPGGLRNETTQLERYRLQYGLHQSDSDLQLAHARFPWVVTWDDHEVDNGYAGDTGSYPLGGFLARRADGYQAY
jgi:alkaline phosphatase D